jgi:hypothetical protein
MADNEQKMAFEGLIYYGVKGATAATLIPETRDMSMTFATDKGNTTTRQDDGSVPIETERVTVRKFQFDFQTLNNPTNAVIAALLAASFAGTPVAFRSKDFTTGKGYDGDVILEHKHGLSLRGEQTLDFTAKPTKSAGRNPTLWT